MGLVADICNDFGFRSISFRSLVQIRNHFRQAIDVYYMTKRGNELAGIGRVEEGQTLNVPPHALYTPTGELFFIPLGYTGYFAVYADSFHDAFHLTDDILVL